MVVPVLSNKVKIGPNGEDRGTHFDRIHLYPAAGLCFRTKLFPKGEDFFHQALVKNATIEIVGRRVNPERVLVTNSAFVLARNVGLDQQIQAQPDDRHLSGRKANTDRSSDVTHILTNRGGT